MEIDYHTRKHYKEIMLEDETIGYIAKDGLLAILPRKYIDTKLTSHHLDHRTNEYYFNITQDRVCAYLLDEDWYYVNPSLFGTTLPKIAII